MRDVQLLRCGTTEPSAEALPPKEPTSFYGFDPFPPRGPAVTNELIDKLREDDAL